MRIRQSIMEFKSSSTTALQWWATPSGCVGVTTMVAVSLSCLGGVMEEGNWAMALFARPCALCAHAPYAWYVSCSSDGSGAEFFGVCLAMA